MPIRNTDIAADHARMRNPRHNPFVARFANAGAESLPIVSAERLPHVQGQWREEFAVHGATPAPAHANNGKVPLIVEIGCHKGLVLTAMAQERADTSFVGIDITFKRVVMTAERARKHRQTNILTSLVNARSLERVFAPCEVDGFVIFFPDPWPKLRQSKHRLLNDEFCAALYRTTSSGGFVWLKTDAESYFVTATESMLRSGFTAASPAETQSFPSQWLPRDYTSAFEMNFSRAGTPTFATVLGKTL